MQTEHPQPQNTLGFFSMNKKQLLPATCQSHYWIYLVKQIFCPLRKNGEEGFEKCLFLRKKLEIFLLSRELNLSLTCDRQMTESSCHKGRFHIGRAFCHNQDSNSFKNQKGMKETLSKAYITFRMQHTKVFSCPLRKKPKVSLGQG